MPRARRGRNASRPHLLAECRENNEDDSTKVGGPQVTMDVHDVSAVGFRRTREKALFAVEGKWTQ